MKSNNQELLTALRYFNTRVSLDDIYYSMDNGENFWMESGPLGRGMVDALLKYHNARDFFHKELLSVRLPEAHPCTCNGAKVKLTALDLFGLAYGTFTRKAREFFEAAGKIAEVHLADTTGKSDNKALLSISAMGMSDLFLVKDLRVVLEHLKGKSEERCLHLEDGSPFSGDSSIGLCVLRDVCTELSEPLSFRIRCSRPKPTAKQLRTAKQRVINCIKAGLDPKLVAILTDNNPKLFYAS